MVVLGRGLGAEVASFDDALVAGVVQVPEIGVGVAQAADRCSFACAIPAAGALQAAYFVPVVDVDLVTVAAEARAVRAVDVEPCQIAGVVVFRTEVAAPGAGL